MANSVLTPNLLTSEAPSYPPPKGVGQLAALHHTRPF